MDTKEAYKQGKKNAEGFQRAIDKSYIGRCVSKQIKEMKEEYKNGKLRSPSESLCTGYEKAKAIDEGKWQPIDKSSLPILKERSEFLGREFNNVFDFLNDVDFELSMSKGFEKVQVSPVQIIYWLDCLYNDMLNDFDLKMKTYKQLRKKADELIEKLEKQNKEVDD